MHQPQEHISARSVGTALWDWAAGWLLALLHRGPRAAAYSGPVAGYSGGVGGGSGAPASTSAAVARQAADPQHRPYDEAYREARLRATGPPELPRYTMRLVREAVQQLAWLGEMARSLHTRMRMSNGTEMSPATVVAALGRALNEPVYVPVVAALVQPPPLSGIHRFAMYVPALPHLLSQLYAVEQLALRAGLWLMVDWEAALTAADVGAAAACPAAAGRVFMLRNSSSTNLPPPTLEKLADGQWMEAALASRTTPQAPRTLASGVTQSPPAAWPPAGGGHMHVPAANLWGSA